MGNKQVRRRAAAEAAAASASAAKDCYCGLWQTNPRSLRDQGIPEGFCGICQRCRQPGHTRHFPGPVPYTGSWCDKCYRNLAWSWPLRSPAVWLMVLVLGFSAFSIYYFLSRMID